MESKIISLPEFSVSDICEDNEKGIWCTTLEKGIFYCRNKGVINYSNIKGLDKKTELLKAFAGKLFTSSNKNELIEINNQEIKKHQLLISGSYALSDILPTDEGCIISGKDFGARFDKQFGHSKMILRRVKYNVGISQMVYGPDKRIFCIQYGILFEISGNVSIDRKDPLESPGKCICYCRNNYLMVGGRDGLYKVDLKTFSFSKIETIKGFVTKILENSDGDIWVATKGNGIYIIKNDSALHFNELFKIPTDRYFDITEDRYKNIWIGSAIGLIKIIPKPGKPQVFIYNSLNGLPSDEIFNVAATNSTLYFSTNEGLCSFTLKSDLTNSTQPNVFINNINVNDKSIKYTGTTLVFPYNENSLKIEFDALTYKENETTTLFYKFNGLDHKPHFIRSNEITLNNLDPGKYELEVYALNNNNRLSKTPVLLKFEIKKPFWQTWLFVLGCILSLVFLLYFSVRKIISRIKKKEEEKTRINKLVAEYQLSALRAQMNPHFIFNCINSIQRYILTNKQQEAYDYLAKFSKLIRHVLNYSDKNIITLTQELEIVELYIELEQLRFENKFTYEILVDDTIDTDEEEVPAMILQPYIENAIWHGFMSLPKNITGNIYIRIRKREDMLEIIVEDNGVGREKSGLLQNKGAHTGKSTTINKKRAEILNIMSHSTKGDVTIEDIKGKDNIIEGTCVTIRIPQRKDE